MWTEQHCISEMTDIYTRTQSQSLNSVGLQLDWLPLKFASRPALCSVLISADMYVVFSHCASWSPEFTSNVKVLAVAKRNKISSVSKRLNATTFRNRIILSEVLLRPVIFSKCFNRWQWGCQICVQNTPNNKTFSVYEFIPK